MKDLAKELAGELKELVEVKVVIKEDAAADRIFEKLIDPMVQKVLDLIPTDIDNAFYAGKKDELMGEFRKLLSAGVDVVEEKTGMDLDGKEEDVQ